MRRVSFLVKPASSACSMACAYCFYRDVAQGRAPQVMSDAVADALIDRALALAPDASIAFDFQGGEPTLAGLPFFERFVARVAAQRDRQHVSFAIQTNGLALDDAWCAFLAEHRFLVGVSLDGYRELHDRLRPDLHGAGTFDCVAAAIARLRTYGLEPSVLMVLSQPLAAHPQKVWRTIERLDLRYVQFIPCLGPLDGAAGRHALTPDAFARFYLTLLGLWERGGRTVHVGLFDDLLALTSGRHPQTCGLLGRCAPQFVVEGDGSVYPCDFYAREPWRLGNVMERSLEELAVSPVLREFLMRPRSRCAECSSCRFESLCHGNCPRMASAYFDERACGYRRFLEQAWPRLATLRKGAPVWM